MCVMSTNVSLGKGLTDNLTIRHFSGKVKLETCNVVMLEFARGGRIAPLPPTPFLSL